MLLKILEADGGGESRKGNSAQAKIGFSRLVRRALANGMEIDTVVT